MLVRLHTSHGILHKAVNIRVLLGMDIVPPGNQNIYYSKQTPTAPHFNPHFEKLKLRTKLVLQIPIVPIVMSSVMLVKIEFKMQRTCWCNLKFDDIGMVEDYIG